MNKPIVYIDTDISLGTPGAEIDDGAALITLLRESDITIAGIGSVFGNVPQENAWKNLQRMAHLLGREEISLSTGAEAPLSSNMSWFNEWQQGYDETLAWGVTEANEHAVDMIIRLAKAYRGRLEVLSIGPMTNLAVAVENAPEIIGMIKEVVVMGGSFNNAQSPPEFNVRCDPEAAQIVFDAEWPLTVFGLEVTRQALFSREMFQSLQTCNPAMLLMKQLAERWIDRVEAMGWEKDGCALHDAVAAAYLLQPDIFSFKYADTISVNLQEGENKGKVSFIKSDNKAGGIRIVNGVDAVACRDLIWARIAGKEVT